jgi:tRNA(Ile)-lysidine synthetase-like protein
VVELGDGWVAEVVFDRLRISQLQGGSQHRSAEESGWGGEAVGEATWGSWCLRWQTEPAGPPGRSGFTTWVTLGSGMVRGLREGDRIRPYRGRGQRKVRRVLMEARVPRADRMRYPVVVRDDDVLWIPGICRSACALPQPGEPALRLDASQR